MSPWEALARRDHGGFILPVCIAALAELYGLPHSLRVLVCVCCLQIRGLKLIRLADGTEKTGGLEMVAVTK
jgi:hypothetical protein